MRVMLKRDLFLGGNRYRQDSRGTEVPDEIGGKKVVFWGRGVEDDPKVIPLPVDAIPYEAGMKMPAAQGGRTPLLKNNANPTPVALSQIPRPYDPQFAAQHAADIRQLGEDEKATRQASAIGEEESRRKEGRGPPPLIHPALRPSPDQPSAGEKPPTALSPAIKPGSDSILADAKAGEGQPDPRTPAAIAAGKGIKPEELQAAANQAVATPPASVQDHEPTPSKDGGALKSGDTATITKK